jgi:hypothetical protein
VLERVRRIVSRKRLHRCTACGWRGWAFALVQMSATAPAPERRLNLRALDAAGDRRPARARRAIKAAV